MGRVGGVVAGVTFVGVAAAAVYWGPGLFDQVSEHVATQACTVTAPSGTYSLTAEQADNAAIIAAIGWSYGYEEQGVTVAIATAIQESGLRNLDYGDRDSVGLFQQRPSQGWGTVEQIQDPRYSAGMFYTALAKVDGWDTMELTVAAQAVQRSGFPDAYAAHEAEATAWARALGGVEGEVTCDLSDPAATSAQAFTERIAADFPQAPYAVEVVSDGASAEDTGSDEGVVTVLGVKPSAATEQVLRRLHAWTIATASTTGVTWADLDGTLWERDGSRIDGEPIPEWADYPGVRVGLQTG